MTENDLTAGPPLPIRPPFIALGLLAVAWLLEWLWSLEPLLAGGVRRYGIALAVAGIALALWALNTFRQRQAPHDPFAQPVNLVESGPYRWSRNPMYLAVFLTLSGIALMAGSLPFMAVPPLFLLIIAVAFVPYEETKLERVLGEPYRQYQRRVRRWL